MSSRSFVATRIRSTTGAAAFVSGEHTSDAAQHSNDAPSASATYTLQRCSSRRSAISSSRDMPHAERSWCRYKLVPAVLLSAQLSRSCISAAAQMRAETLAAGSWPGRRAGSTQPRASSSSAVRSAPYTPCTSNSRAAAVRGSGHSLLTASDVQLIYACALAVSGAYAAVGVAERKASSSGVGMKSVPARQRK
jgi:hypothetical protein